MKIIKFLAVFLGICYLLTSLCFAVIPGQYQSITFNNNGGISSVNSVQIGAGLATESLQDPSLPPTSVISQTNTGGSGRPNTNTGGLPGTLPNTADSWSIIVAIWITCICIIVACYIFVFPRKKIIR